MHVPGAILLVMVCVALAGLAAGIVLRDGRKRRGARAGANARARARGERQARAVDDTGARLASAATAASPSGKGDGAPAETEDERMVRQRADLDERSSRAERAERADQLRNLLVSKMSHDIRTPLNSVITLSQLLNEGNAGALSLEQRRYVDIINRSGQTLLALVNDILDLASLEAGRLEVEVTPVDLRQIARAIVDGCAVAARRKGLPMHLNLPRRPPGPILARADEERLRHVLVSLVDHAVAETRNGYVELSVDSDGRAAIVRVADTSSGIAAEARAALYDDFLAGLGPFAGQPAPPLALVVAGRLVKLMGGTIAVDSAGGEGTTFTITLPLATEEPAARAARDDDAPAVEAAGGAVLLIEDDEIERRRVGAILEAAGYDVVLASSGQEGLALLQAAHYDAVVLDLVMPGMSGLDVLRVVRADEQLAATPFVVLSALYMTKGERAVLGPGVAGVVRKGDATAEELASCLHGAIGRAKRLAAEPATGAAAGSTSAGRTPAVSRARVLVVEDNVDNLFTIEQVLASLPVTIETASSGPEAIELCRHHPPDLIMMDVELPGMSGLEASRAIRALPDCAKIPIIAITADAMQGDRERALAAQCSGYLAKPVQPLDVVSAVTRALQLETH
jgi:two-component system sensor histidine kinase/response regulator